MTKSDYSEPSKDPVIRWLNQQDEWRVVAYSRVDSSGCSKNQHYPRGEVGEPCVGAPTHFPVGKLGTHTVSRLGDRLIVWKNCDPNRVVSVVSSRMGRAVDERAAWFQALRATCCKVANENSLLLEIPGTAASAYVQRASELFGIPTVPVDVAVSDAADAPNVGDSNDSLDCLTKWFSDVELEESHQPAIFVSPSLSGASQATPLRDQLAVLIPGSIVALLVRPGGNILKLLEARLESFETPIEGGNKVRLAIGENLTRAATRDSLLKAGAVGWYLFESRGSSGPSPSVPDDVQSVDASVVARRIHRAEHQPKITDVPDDVLIHCTRRSHGPWPDESSGDRLKDLILSKQQADHSALATLMHIVETRRLFASSQSTRGPVPVVSFTSVRLEELSELRVFRSHRGRWDFEPYGICIKRKLMESRGARAVSYASDAEWERLSEEDRPFFQLSKSVTSSGNILDWTVEQEWRQTGDVDLESLGHDDAWLFCPSEEEAARLRNISPWPVVVI